MKNPLTRVFRGGRRDRKSANLTPDGLRITEFPAPVTQMLRLYNAGGSYAAIFASQPNVRTVIDDISREAAELSLKMYLKDPRGENMPDGRIEVDHGMVELLSAPEPGMSEFRFWRSLFADIAIYDLAIWRKIRNGSGPPKSLLRYSPASITPEIDPLTGTVKRWHTYDGTPVPTKDLVVFWGFDPAVNHGSISPLETLRRLLAEEQAVGQDREHRWHNSLRKDGIIEQSSDAVKMSDDARESFLTDVEESLSGASGTARPLMLEPGQVWKDVQWSPKEMEYIEGRKLNRLEVAAAFHYPAAKVLASGSEPNEQTLHYFYTSTLPPYLSRVEREIEAQLLPEFEVSAATRRTFYVEFNLDAKLRGSFEQQAAIMATTAGGPVITVNEARARLNLPPIEGGDQLQQPMNSQPAGGPQASPQNPMDTPAEGLNPAGTTPSPVPASGNGTAPVSGLAARDHGGSILEEHDAKIAVMRGKADQVAYLREQRIRYENRFAKLFEKFFSRHRNAVIGGKAAGADRWDRELADDLYGATLQTVEAIGTDTAKRIRGKWSTERTSNYLREHAQQTARQINAATRSMLEGDTDPEDVFSEERMSGLAMTLATFAIGWGIAEAVHQNEDEGAFEKTWITTSETPRSAHAALDGVSVPIGDTFPNGLRFPGDGATGDAAEVANCSCIMTVSAA